MRPGRHDYTLRVYSHAWQFVRENPEYAAAARPLFQVMGLRFTSATIGATKGDIVSRVTVECESASRCVWVCVWPTDDGLATEVVLDKPIERRA